MDRSQRSCLRLLTLGKPPFVAAGYRKALAGAASFARDAACDQLMIYQRLGLLTESVAEALKVFDGPAEEKKKATQGRILLFTGHRIDAAGREKPRFPPDQEGVACEAIKNAVAAEMTQPGGIEIGLAGGASGGDILFHEVCAELGVPTQLMLGLPRQDFVVASVAPAGPRWIERFDAIYAKPDRRELSDSASYRAGCAAKQIMTCGAATTFGCCTTRWRTAHSARP